MVMNGCEFDFPCDVSPERARSAAAGYLIKTGYELRDRDEKRVKLKFDGTYFTTSIQKITHYVEITSAPGVLHFEFSTGIVASYWGDADRAFAEERATNAARAAIAHAQGEEAYRSLGPQLPPMAACTFCGKINLVSASACSCCGAATSG